MRVVFCGPRDTLWSHDFHRKTKYRSWPSQGVMLLMVATSKTCFIAPNILILVCFILHFIFILSFFVFLLLLLLPHHLRSLSFS